MTTEPSRPPTATELAAATDRAAQTLFGDQPERTEPTAEDNPRAAQIMGKRETDVIAFDQPVELGYRCPACPPYDLIDADGEFDERLTWSEYNGFLWCRLCELDVPSALCLPHDLPRATEIFLASTADAIAHAANSQADVRAAAAESVALAATVPKAGE